MDQQHGPLTRIYFWRAMAVFLWETSPRACLAFTRSMAQTREKTPDFSTSLHPADEGEAV